MFALLAICLGNALAEEPVRVQRTVLIDATPRPNERGQVEFVACSKSCHDGKLTSEHQVVPERNIPADRKVIDVDGAWPVTTQLSMRTDLYYFALYAAHGTAPEERRFSLRTHAGEGDTVHFEVGPRKITDRPPMGPLPDFLSHLEGEVETADTETAATTVPDPGTAPAAAGPPVRPPDSSRDSLILALLLALGAGGLVGWLIHRLQD